MRASSDVNLILILISEPESESECDLCWVSLFEGPGRRSIWHFQPSSSGKDNTILPQSILNAPAGKRLTVMLPGFCLSSQYQGGTRRRREKGYLIRRVEKETVRSNDQC